MTAKLATELIQAAAYIRMSTSKQEDSPQRQRMQITEYAQRNGYNIVRWYQDDGMTGTESSKRGSYQELLSDISLGSFTAVIIAEMSRLSREDIFEVMPQWSAFRKAGITLVSCMRGPIELDSMQGFLTACIDQFSSHDEVKKLANRVVTGKILCAERGQRIGGLRVFGYDRLIMDSSGNVIKRVLYMEQFRNSPNMTTVLAPAVSDGSAHAIQWAFQSILDGGSLHSVVREFSRRGLKTVHGRDFSITAMQQLLRNPTYMGITVAGGQCCGKFHRMDESRPPFIIENSHPPIVSKEVFEAVGAVLASKSKWKREDYRDYLLSGLCVCGRCGAKLSGCTNVAWQKRANDANWWNYSSYFCAKCRSVNSAVMYPAMRVEAAVLETIRELFLTRETTMRLKSEPEPEPLSLYNHELLDLREKMKRTRTNLALAESPEDFREISAELAGMRKRESELTTQTSRVARKARVFSADVNDAISRFAGKANLLDRWLVITAKQREKLFPHLRIVLSELVGSIILNCQSKTGSWGSRSFRSYSGLLKFKADIDNGPVEFGHEQLGSPHRQKFLEVADFLQREGKAIHIDQIAKHFAMSRDGTYYRLRRAKDAGLVTKTAPYTWRATS